ncbi:amidase [Natronolimnobius baerhuensis]|uniref:Amidase n=1 Tax=Natronolimnobius baerhuensis TaxID=253108 RepID=A0A202E519_9EURY|nr:amidase [Natronolimnobius baerhuensis]OVE83396.1 amidase [Natronolimnobius baerhuensis]
MPIRPPTADELQDLGSELFLELTDDESEFFREQIVESHEDYETVRSYQPNPRLGGTEPRMRSAGTRPDDADNPHQLWVSRCDVRGDDGGDLEGWDVAIKDNICVAGVEMTCGSHVIEGYVPDVDATVVSRLLEAGADVVGKTNMDDMALTRTGHSAFGTITNPHDEDHLAGGSSGGSAVAVVEDEVDMAIGSDQGGSVRIPAALCGIVGHKPTHGLVPYTGCVGLEHMIDHPGPMATDVETVARTLSVIAGSNERDLRRPEPVPVEQYEEHLTGETSDLSIGVLEEGFGKPAGDPAVEDAVLDSLDLLEERGATVDDVSVPLHADASALHSVCTNEGLVAALSGQGVGHGWKAWYNVSWIESFGKFRQAQGDDFPAALKLSLLTGAYMATEYHSRYYAAGMNLVVELAQQYDEVLAEYDVLAMPTVDVTAPECDPDRTEFERIEELEIPGNTSPFNRTGHPAVSVPAGDVDGLPVGCMFVGSRFDDATALDAGYALEQARNEQSN